MAQRARSRLDVLLIVDLPLQAFERECIPAQHPVPAKQQPARCPPPSTTIGNDYHDLFLLVPRLHLHNGRPPMGRQFVYRNIVPTEWVTALKKKRHLPQWDLVILPLATRRNVARSRFSECGDDEKPGSHPKMCAGGAWESLQVSSRQLEMRWIVAGSNPNIGTGFWTQ